MQTYGELHDLAAMHACPDHPQATVEVAWDKGLYRLRCGAGHWVDKLQRLMMPSEMFRQGVPQDPNIENTIRRRYPVTHDKDLPERPENRVEITETGKTALQRKEEHAREEETRLPVIYEASTGGIAPLDLRRRVVEWARETELRPELGHVCLYHGKPWVTIDGWYYRFRLMHPNGQLLSRPLTSEERYAAGITDTNLHAWRAEVYDVPGGHLLAMGHGYASQEEPLAQKSPVETRWPWRMAEKRAEEDALSKAVPLGI